MYTFQRDAYGNTIVCKGTVCRRGYRIEFTGSYIECFQLKAASLAR